MALRLVCAVVCALICVTQAYGWGPGHNAQTRLMFESLPKQIQEFLPADVKERLIRKYSHYPDAFNPLEESEFGAKAMDLFKQHRIKTRYSFHKDRGRLVAVKLLIEEFKNMDNPQRTALLMGIISHSIGDEGACNHDPFIHYITYALAAYKLKMAKGVGLDFYNVANDKSGKVIIRELMEGFKPKVISDKPAKVMERLWLVGVEANVYMTKRGALIAATYAPKAKKNVREAGSRALAELGVNGAKLAANFVVTAWHFAKNDVAFDFTPDTYREFKKIEHEFLACRSINDDSIFSGLLDSNPAGKAVGVLIEPSQKMNGAYMAFSAKYLMSAAMTLMKKNGVPYRALNLRDVDVKGLRSPDSIPVIVICSGYARIPAGALDALKKYVKGGGKLLWIGGRDRKLLGKLSESLETVEDSVVPVSKKYGLQNAESIKISSIFFKGDFALALGEKKYPFIRNPNTPAGWHKPYCPYRVKIAGSGLESLAELRVGEKRMDIAAVLRDKKGNATHVFVPEYLVAPYLLTDPKGMIDVSWPRLDEVGRAVLTESLKLLVPGLVPKKTQQ